MAFKKKNIICQIQSKHLHIVRFHFTSQLPPKKKGLKMSSTTSSMNREQLENFIEDNLRKKLKEYDMFINKTNAEIMEFVQLKNICENIGEHLSDGFKTQVNIGGNFFLSAKVPDTEHIMINVGLNHYVDFTMSEAIKFCDLKIKSLENETNVIREKSIETRASIKLALLCIDEQLSKEARSQN